MPLKRTMRADGSPARDAVASATASGCSAPARPASANHRSNIWTGSPGISDSMSGGTSAGSFLRHVLAQLLEGGPLQPRHVHLADTQPARDLRLGHLLVKPHGHDRPLARRQVLHGPVEQVSHLHTIQLEVLGADRFGHGTPAFAIRGAQGLVE